MENSSRVGYTEFNKDRGYHCVTYSNKIRQNMLEVWGNTWPIYGVTGREEKEDERKK